MDFDPATQCWYEPVICGEEEIASQNGLPPSEGNPQFHQQFVYAVAMKTIRHFEHAWAGRLSGIRRSFRRQHARCPRSGTCGGSVNTCSGCGFIRTRFRGANALL